jgi:hypothetical protein|tara:strand:- start:219 stop:434 length:216 start_codon:yes stop_codon:yes gene_type:complete
LVFPEVQWERKTGRSIVLQPPNKWSSFAASIVLPTFSALFILLISKYSVVVSVFSGLLIGMLIMMKLSSQL